MNVMRMSHCVNRDVNVHTHERDWLYLIHPVICSKKIIVTAGLT